MGEGWEFYDRIDKGLKGFAQDMRLQGIHVGLGTPGVCVVDGEAWPCEHERSERVQA